MLADKRRSSELRIVEVLGRRAVRLDAEARKVELDDGTVLEGDAIVIATGAEPRRLPGTEDLGQRDGLFTLRTLDDSIALRDAVTAVDVARVVVIGAGFIGAEVASTCAGLGCRVTVLEALDIPLCNVLGPMIGSHFAGLHGAQRRLELRANAGVGVRGIRRADADDAAATAGSGGPRRLVVELDGGEIFPADAVVVGIGVSPTTDWLAGSGLSIDNGVVCDDRLFGADGIVAAGDLARWSWRHDGGEEQIRIEHWQVAAEAGVAAGAQCAGGKDGCAIVHARSVLLVRSVRHSPAGVGQSRRGRRRPHHRWIAREGKFVALFGRAARRGRGRRQTAPADELPATDGVGEQLGRRARRTRRHKAPAVRCTAQVNARSGVLRAQVPCSRIPIVMRPSPTQTGLPVSTIPRVSWDHCSGAQKGPEGPFARLTHPD